MRKFSVPTWLMIGALPVICMHRATDRRCARTGRRLVTLLSLTALQTALLSGCIGTATSQTDSSGLSVIGDVRGDGPPRRIDRDRLDLADAVPHQLALSATGNAPYVLGGRTFTPLKSGAGYVATGVASWYGKKFHGRRTSSGEPYDMYAMTAAHRILPLPSFVRVTNLVSGQQAIVKVNDRGPFRNDRIIDLSYAAAVKLGADVDGTIDVRVEVVQPSTADSKPQTPSQDSLATESETPTQDYRLFLQAGAFSSEINANRLRQQLLRSGIEPVEVAPHSVKDGTVYRVRIGPLDSQQSASQQQVRLNREFNTHGRLVYQRIEPTGQ